MLAKEFIFLTEPWEKEGGELAELVEEKNGAHKTEMRREEKWNFLLTAIESRRQDRERKPKRLFSILFHRGHQHNHHNFYRTQEGGRQIDGGFRAGKMCEHSNLFATSAKGSRSLFSYLSLLLASSLESWWSAYSDPEENRKHSTFLPLVNAARCWPRF